MLGQHDAVGVDLIQALQDPLGGLGPRAVGVGPVDRPVQKDPAESDNDGQGRQGRRRPPGREDGPAFVAFPSLGQPVTGSATELHPAAGPEPVHDDENSGQLVDEYGGGEAD